MNRVSRNVKFSCSLLILLVSVLLSGCSNEKSHTVGIVPVEKNSQPAENSETKIDNITVYDKEIDLDGDGCAEKLTITRKKDIFDVKINDIFVSSEEATTGNEQNNPKVFAIETETPKKILVIAYYCSTLKLGGYYKVKAFEYSINSVKEVIIKNSLPLINYINQKQVNFSFPELNFSQKFDLIKEIPKEALNIDSKIIDVSRNVGYNDFDGDGKSELLINNLYYSNFNWNHIGFSAILFKYVEDTLVAKNLITINEADLYDFSNLEDIFYSGYISNIAGYPRNISEKYFKLKNKKYYLNFAK